MTYLTCSLLKCIQKKPSIETVAQPETHPPSTPASPTASLHHVMPNGGNSQPRSIEITIPQHNQASTAASRTTPISPVIAFAHKTDEVNNITHLVHTDKSIDFMHICL